MQAHCGTGCSPIMLRAHQPEQPCFELGTLQLVGKLAENEPQWGRRRCTLNMTREALPLRAGPEGRGSCCTGVSQPERVSTVKV